MRFENVRAKRIEAQLPAVAVAQAANRSLAWVYAVERGVLSPSLEDAEKVASLLESRPDELFSVIREPAPR